MRFAIISNEGTGLSLWRRIYDEGNEVLVWIAPFKMRKVGLGIVPITGSYEALRAWGLEHPDTIFLFDCSGQGEKADDLRKRGALVVGGGSFCDKLEQKRAWGENFATQAGCITPETLEHASLSQTISWLKKHDDGRGWYFKSNKYLGADATQGKRDAERMVRYLEFLQHKLGDSIAHILQEKLDGIDISTACYWNGTAWVGPFEGTVEHKKFMDGDIGPSTGCCFNLVWFYDSYPKICEELHWSEFTQTMREQQAPPGIYDINALVCEKDGRARFLEWTPRFGFDSEPTAWRAIAEPIGQVFSDLATGRLARMPFDMSCTQMSLRLSISPYPWENNDELPLKKTCVDTPVNGIDGFYQNTFVAYGLGCNNYGELVMKDPGGLLGLAATSGFDLSAMSDELLDFCKEELDVSGLQYRTDAAKTLGEHVEALRDLGYDVPHVVCESEEET